MIPQRGAAPADHPVIGQTRILEALSLLAVDPALGGVVLLGVPGSGRCWLAHVYPRLLPAGAPFLAAAGGDGPQGLQDQLDWEQSLREGRRVTRPGLWNRARGGALFFPNGDAMDRATAAWLARALGEPQAPALLIACTPGEEGGLAPLAFRLAFWLPLETLESTAEREGILRSHWQEPAPVSHPGGDAGAGWSHLQASVAAARRRLAFIPSEPGLWERVCKETARRGFPHPGLDYLVFRAARARAALQGRDRVAREDVEVAVELVVAGRHPGTLQEMGATGGKGARERAVPPHNPPSATASSENPQASEGGSPGRPSAGRHSVGRTGVSRMSENRGGIGSGEQTPLLQGPNPGGHEPPRYHAPLEDRAPRREPAAALLPVYRAVEEVHHHRLAHRLAGGLPSSPHREPRGYSRRPGRNSGARRVPSPPRLAPPAGGPPTPAERSPARLRAGVPKGGGGRLALVPSLIAALPHQPFRRPRRDLALTLEPRDLRWWEGPRAQEVLYILAVDASGSMGRTRTRAAKGLARALLRRAYLQRAQVCLIEASGREARVLLPPSRSGAKAYKRLDQMATGGGTPLASALAIMETVARRFRSRFPAGQVVGLLLTDGRPNVPWRAESASRSHLLAELQELATHLRRQSIPLLVLDRDVPGTPARDAQELAHVLQAAFLPL